MIRTAPWPDFVFSDERVGSGWRVSSPLVGPLHHFHVDHPQLIPDRLVQRIPLGLVEEAGFLLDEVHHVLLFSDIHVGLVLAFFPWPVFFPLGIALVCIALIRKAFHWKGVVWSVSKRVMVFLDPLFILVALIGLCRCLTGYSRATLDNLRLLSHEELAKIWLVVYSRPRIALNLAILAHVSTEVGYLWWWSATYVHLLATCESVVVRGSGEGGCLHSVDTNHNPR